MNEVEAVRDQALIPVISKQLTKHHSQQMADVWDLGLQLALRISDILSLTFDHVKGDYIELVEQKTGKVAKIHLNIKAVSIIDKIRAECPDSVYIFQSRSSRNLKGRVKPISRQAVTKAFSEVGEIVGIKLGTHSMRKTRGFHQYKRSHDIGSVMKMLRHSSEAVTLKYIGITQEQVDRDFAEMIL